MRFFHQDIRGKTLGLSSQVSLLRRLAGKGSPTRYTGQNERVFPFMLPASSSMLSASSSTSSRLHGGKGRALGSRTAAPEAGSEPGTLQLQLSPRQRSSAVHLYLRHHLLYDLEAYYGDDDGGDDDVLLSHLLPEILHRVSYD